jgi:hypothetical protein
MPDDREVFLAYVIAAKTNADFATRVAELAKVFAITGPEGHVAVQRKLAELREVVDMTHR